LRPVSADSKRAEQAYLERAGTERWERVKPFSSPGHDDVAEGARLIHDVAVALLCLELKPDERVLDLGAGSCWVSEWLGRFNVETISVDIAIDMLRVGQSRMGPGARLVVGDLEALPLAAESVDKAVCLNAFHHVPDGEAALREIHRVLKRGGRVLLGEPGRGHAANETSVSAVGDYGVQERDVIASTLVADCVRAGFAKVVIKPLVYAVPWYEIDAERWARWERYAAERRPLRASKRVMRAVAEGLGIGKETGAFEDSLGMELVRIVKGAIENHPIVLAV
jgi:demethylmenaquinone methyltransferase/2-methoxy-6-polyprenyl-1,4-benzoquinol methylase